MSRPVDPTLRHGRITGASDALEAVRTSRMLRATPYEGRHRLGPTTSAMHYVDFIVKLGGCGAPRRGVEDTDLIVWRREVTS